MPRPKKIKVEVPKGPPKKRGRKPKPKVLSIKTEEGYTEIPLDGLKFPWTGNPDYFKSESTPLSISEMTKESCAYPNRYLDDQCFGCSIYDSCRCSLKYNKEDMKKPVEKVKIKKLSSFDS